MNAKIALKRVLGKIIACGGGATQNRKIILLYHSIGEGPWALPKSEFRRQIDWLSNNATLISLDGLLAGENIDGRPRVAITFDDGYASLRDAACDVLRESGANATVFLNTGRIGKKSRTPSDAGLGHYPGEQFMSWQDVVDLVANGWTVGSHGVEHLDLTAAADDIARQQLRLSKETIERELSAPCANFAYTWGRHTPRLRQLVEEAGYRHAFSGRHGPLLADSDRFALPRVAMSNDYSLDDLRAIVAGDWDYIGWIQKFTARL